MPDLGHRPAQVSGRFLQIHSRQMAFNDQPALLGKPSDQDVQKLPAFHFLKGRIRGLAAWNRSVRAAAEIIERDRL